MNGVIRTRRRLQQLLKVQQGRMMLMRLLLRLRDEEECTRVTTITLLVVVRMLVSMNNRDPIGNVLKSNRLIVAK